MKTHYPSVKSHMHGPVPLLFVVDRHGTCLCQWPRICCSLAADERYRLETELQKPEIAGDKSPLAVRGLALYTYADLTAKLVGFRHSAVQTAARSHSPHCRHYQTQHEKPDCDGRMCSPFGSCGHHCACFGGFGFVRYRSIKWGNYTSSPIRPDCISDPTGELGLPTLCRFADPRRIQKYPAEEKH